MYLVEIQYIIEVLGVQEIHSLNYIVRKEYIHHILDYAPKGYINYNYSPISPSEYYDLKTIQRRLDLEYSAWLVNRQSSAIVRHFKRIKKTELLNKEIYEDIKTEY